MHEIKFGHFITPANVAEAQEAAREDERDGFYSISHNDHFYSPLGSAESPQLECFTALTAIAAVTNTIRLVPCVAVAQFRTPALLAKITTSLDLASNGRFICGLGAGWQGPEYDAHGYPFPPLAQRLEQLDETLHILKAMWTQDVPAYTGKHYAVFNAYNHPRGVQQPHPPIMLGGSGTGLLRIAAAHADILNLIPPTSNNQDFINDRSQVVRFDTARLLSRIAVLHGFAEDLGRDPRTIELGGLVFMALSRKRADPALQQIAADFGFSDYAAAQRAPALLLGTPDEAKRELERRIAETGMTYYIGIFASEETRDLLVANVMPVFASRSAHP